MPLSTLIGLAVLTASVWVVVRLAGLAIRPGVHPVQSGPALAVWVTMRVLDEARTWLFPLYSSQLTSRWLRALGARIGRDVEASTVLMIPSLTQVNDQAFLADDTLIGGYELGGGWLRVERVKIGKRAFVGNSGMAAPGRKVPKSSLVAVLSAAPRRSSARSGESWLGSPPAPLRRVAQSVRQRPDLRPARRSQGRSRRDRAVPAGARHARRRPDVPRSRSPWWPPGTAAASYLPCCWPHRSWRWPAPSPPSSPWWPSGC